MSDHAESEGVGVSVSWDSQIDTLLAKWCDTAKCYEWMHSESFSICEKNAHIFLITINSITAVSGIANTVVGGLTINGIQCAWIFGGVSILISTLNILQDKLGYIQNAAIHKKLIAQWSAIRMKIEEVLSIPYSARKDCKSVLHFLRTDIRDAEREGSGLIGKYIRNSCYTHFKDVDNFDLPDICGKVEHTQIYKEPLLP
jgi:hypothetical protein